VFPGTGLDHHAMAPDARMPRTTKAMIER